MPNLDNPQYPPDTTSMKYGTFEFKFDNNYPIPKVSWGLERARTGPGDLLSDEITIKLDGIIAISGGGTTIDIGQGNNINAVDVDQLITSAKNLQNNIFNNDGKLFNFTFSSVPMVTGYATVKDLTFSENDNYWTNYINYSLELAIPQTGSGSHLIDPNGSNYNLTNCEDTYNFKETERKYQDPYSVGEQKPIYELTRNISATAKAYANAKSGSLIFAKHWVYHREKEYPLIDLFPSEDYKLFNRKRNIDFSETDGRYSISDNFIVKDGEPWIYNNTIKAGYESSNFLRTISIDGEIEGLEPATGVYQPNLNSTNSLSGNLDISGMFPLEGYTKNDRSSIPGKTDLNVTKYENALSGYYKLITDNIFFDQALSYDAFSQNLISDNFRAGNFSNYKTKPLHAIPFSITEGLDPQKGRVSFSRTFNSRPTGLLKGSLFEALNLSDSKPKSLITPVPIIGRRLGPLYYNPYGANSQGQYVSGVGTRTVTFEAFFAKPTGLGGYKFPIEEINKIDTYLRLYAPSNYGSYITEDSQDLDLTDNKLTKTITWEYIKCSPTTFS